MRELRDPAAGISIDEVEAVTDVREENDELGYLPYATAFMLSETTTNTTLPHQYDTATK